MIKNNLHIYPSAFRFETRILKETNSIISQNLVQKVEIASIWESSLLEVEKINECISVKRFKLISQRLKKGKISDALKYLEFVWKTFSYYKKENLEYVNCHSLLVLVIGVLLKKFGNSKHLIYDAHELETERAGLNGVTQKFTKWLEKKLIVYVDKVIVVCEPIANWYKNEYQLNEVFVVQNMPYKYHFSENKPTLLKDNFNIPLCDLLFIYQGVLAKERGINILLEVFEKTQKNKHIVFMGYGPSESQIINMSKRHSNIHFQPAVKTSDIIKYTESADVGIFFINGPICLSYQFSLPNKFGEYLMAGLPVIISSSLSYMSSIIEQKKCGWIINSDNGEVLTKLINEMENGDLDIKKSHVLNYASTLGWEYEQLKYKSIYKI